MPEHPKNKPRLSQRLYKTASSFWRNISYRKKTILYTSIILYVFILVFGVLIYSRAVSSMNQMHLESTQQRLQSLDEELKAQFSGYSIITTTLLLDNNFQEKLAECPDSVGAATAFDYEIMEYLTALCSSTRYPTSWDLYYTYDRPEATGERLHLIHEAENTGWFSQLTAQRRNIITWRLELEEPDSPLHFSCSIGVENRKTGVIPAYFKMNVALEHLYPAIRTAADNVDGVFLLCSQDGQLLWSHGAGEQDYTSYILPYKTIEPLVPVDMNGSLGERTVIALDGGKYGYTIFCVQDNSYSLSRYMAFGSYFLLILCAVIILSLVLMRSSAGLVDGRIMALTADIKALDEADLNYLPDTTSQDEVGELSRAFSELVERIKLLIEHEHQFEEERFELEVEALQAQINPHFLFNTLSIINLLAREIEADNISQALEALANFYRYSLHDGDKMTSLEDELVMLDNYLTICAIRYRNQLQVSKKIDPQALECIIPKLILQPFCENAVFHGFSAGSGKTPSLSISAKRHSDHLLVSIIDNGDGMSHSELKKATKTGFAITNVHKRIQMLYGEEYGVTITSTPGQGTQVQIKLGLAVKDK